MNDTPEVSLPFTFASECMCFKARKCGQSELYHNGRNMGSCEFVSSKQGSRCLFIFVEIRLQQRFIVHGFQCEYLTLSLYLGVDVSHFTTQLQGECVVLSEGFAFIDHEEGDQANKSHPLGTTEKVQRCEVFEFILIVESTLMTNHAHFFQLKQLCCAVFVENFV